MSNSATLWTVSPTRLLCPWDFPAKNTGVGCHFLLQGIFPTQDWTCISCVSCIASRFFTSELPEKPNLQCRNYLLWRTIFHIWLKSNIHQWQGKSQTLHTPISCLKTISLTVPIDSSGQNLLTWFNQTLARLPSLQTYELWSILSPSGIRVQHNLFKGPWCKVMCWTVFPCLLKSKSPVPQSVVLFGNRVFVDVIREN